MPSFNLFCQSCGASTKKLADSWLALITSPTKRLCGCGAEWTRNATGPSASKIERLDNGIMTRALERPADAEELFRERARTSDPLAGGVQGHGTK